MSYKNAFSLLELSVVLLIISLITGGVIAGKQLISEGKVRAQISQIEEFNSATLVFRDLYNSLPGDISPAHMHQFFPTLFPDFTGTDYDQRGGDENGLIFRTAFGPAYPPSTSCIYEVDDFFNHLSIAKLVSGNYQSTSSPNNQQVIGTTYPKMKIGSVVAGVLPYADADRVNYFRFGVVGSSNGTVIINNVLTPEEAFSIDQKMDDGLSRTGKVSSTGSTAFTNNFGLAGSEQCIDGSTSSGYKVSVKSPSCNMRIRMDTNQRLTR